MDEKKIEITELEYIQLKERCDSNYKAYVKADDEVNNLKLCMHCYYNINNQDWSDDGVCRKCCHKNNFKPILAKYVRLKL